MTSHRNRSDCAERDQHNNVEVINTSAEFPDYRGGEGQIKTVDRLLRPEDVAVRLNVSKDWVWDHSSRKAPLLPVIRLANGTLRYRASKIEQFIEERERLSSVRRYKVK